MNKKGVSEVIAAVLLITLVVATSLIFAYFYSDFIYEQKDSIEGTVFEELGLEGRCAANWADCKDWSECEISYNLDDLIGGDIELQGVERRSCKDINECAQDKIEEQKCSARKLVALDVVEESGREYIEIRDKDGDLVSKVSKDEEAGTLYIDLYV
jgi:hypothetical protein